MALVHPWVPPPPGIHKSVIMNITNHRVVQHVISQKKSPNDPVILLRGCLPSWQGYTLFEVGALLWIRHLQTTNRSAKAWDKLLHYAIFRQWILCDARSCLWDVQNNSQSTRQSGSKWRLVAGHRDNLANGMENQIHNHKRLIFPVASGQSEQRKCRLCHLTTTGAYKLDAYKNMSVMLWIDLDGVGVQAGKMKSWSPARRR